MLPTAHLPDSTIASSDSHYDRQLAKILEHATAIFYEKGYERLRSAIFRGLAACHWPVFDYYFESKEKLLYVIQMDLFVSVMYLIRERLKDESDPEQRVRIFIHTHLEYFLANPKSMKVLSHEDDVLTGELGKEITGLKRQYYHCCAEPVDALKAARSLEFNSRVAVLSLFGMMNWIYTWHNANVDGDAAVVAPEIGDVFLRGIYAVPAPVWPEMERNFSRRVEEKDYVYTTAIAAI